MRVHLLTIAFSFCLLGSSQADEVGERFLDRIAHYPIVVEGEVLRVTPQYSMTGAVGYWTLLEFRPTSYLRGDGPDTIHVQLRWIKTDSLVTTSAHDGRVFLVPSAGDAAILWIMGSEYDALPSSLYPQCEGIGTKPVFAEMTSDLQIWPTIADSLPALGCSLNEGRRLIVSAVELTSISTQIHSAKHIVLGRWQAHERCAKSVTCVTISVSGVPKGEVPSDTVSIGMTTKLPRRCYETMALYLLMDPDSTGAFRPVHANSPCFPVVEGRVIIDYRIVSGKPIDCLAPVDVPLDDVVGAR